MRRDRMRCSSTFGHESCPDARYTLKVHHGLVLLKLAERDAYGRHCQLMLDQFEGSSRPYSMRMGGGIDSLHRCSPRKRER